MADQALIGMAAGAAGINPYAAGAQAIGAALSGGPSSADSGLGNVGNQWDGSGWTVSTGSSRADGATIARNDPTGGLAAGVGNAIGGMDYTTLAVVAVVGVVLWAALQRKR